MGRWKNTKTGEQRVTGDNSPLERKIATLPDWEPLDDAAETADDANPQKPAKNALKADWVAYAVSRGVDDATAEAMTQPDLVAMFAEATEKH